jgi:hypothetical protein
MTPWASSTFVVTSDWEDKIDEFMDKACAEGGYLSNRDWTRRVAKDSYARFQDLVSWGVPFPRDEEGNYKKLGLGGAEFPAIWMTDDDATGSWVSPLRAMTNSEGGEVPGFGFGLNADFEAHAGRAPLYRGEMDCPENAIFVSPEKRTPVLTSWG